MKTIQIVIEEDLLEATDRAARQAKINRSALVRRALRRHLLALRREELEESDRRGYQRQPASEETVLWEGEAVWPEQ